MAAAEQIRWSGKREAGSWKLEADIKSPVMTDPSSGHTGDRHMRRSYVRVLLAWIAALAALYAFQEYFS
jgi:hypothetical protein